MKQLEETDLRIADIAQPGHRPRMYWEHAYRCVCRRCYLMHSPNYLSCPQCKRVWPTATLEEKT